MSAPQPPKPLCEFVYMDGEFVPWAEATVHGMSHALHYGSSVFEGIRVYDTPSGPACFRLREHLERLLFSARILRMDIPHTVESLTGACLETVRRNGLGACYIRPIIFRGTGSVGLYPEGTSKQLLIAAWPWGAYLGKEGMERGIDAMVSSWRKPQPGSVPVLAKVGGAYALASLAKMEAKRLGYDEAIFLDSGGCVAEGTGENVFAVVEGELLTPPLASSVLSGITRRSIMQLARDRDIPVDERPIPRSALHLASELFLTGTAAEVTPVRSVDQIPVGDGVVGPTTAILQRAFFDVVEGRSPDVHGWLTPVGTVAGKES